MKKKSDSNIRLAQDLINKTELNASVHCSYYGCFQFIKCILKNNIGISYETQNKKRDGSHDFIITSLANEIASAKTLKHIRTDFYSLQEKRIIADYYQDDIDMDTSLLALQEAISVIFKINNALGGLKI